MNIIYIINIFTHFLAMLLANNEVIIESNSRISNYVQRREKLFDV